MIFFFFRFSEFQLENLSIGISQHSIENLVGEVKIPVSIHFIGEDKNAYFPMLSWGNVLQGWTVNKPSSKVPQRGNTEKVAAIVVIMMISEIDFNS